MATQDQPRANDAQRFRYEEALRSFVDKVQQDRYIVAAILFGSLAYDDVWEKSDVDILLVSRDDRAAERSYSLVENNINFHVNIGPRGKFKEQIERALQGSFMHSVMARSTLLFSTDETIQEYYQHVHHVGSRDREMQMLNAAARVLPVLTKAEKWLVVKRDPIYSFHWFIFLIDSLATIEVLWHADVPGREVIQQALSYNPDFFKPLYTDLIQRPKDTETMREAIQMVHNYLDERRDVLFKPILRYLTAAGSVRSASEIEEHLRQRTGNGYLALACEWLADKGILRKVSSPLRLTEKSRVTLDEAAYYYDGGDIHHAD
ncbi:MAG: nucleotidyltransferase domain-containing protein [Ktedonobacteraceae bacterium]|nr:nucleotidyltransferase domain-containing protein [Ktedonobacteraceae bacterium]MBO0792342.1 nucleotidyltransferase domain-containing protein [Ktedonobacteraceae bacterium]